MIEAKPYSTLFSHAERQPSEVTVCISLYNYESYILEALDSVYRQSIDQLDLIIVDDCSKDNSVAVTQKWLESRCERFNTVHLVQHSKNSGLAASRNTALSLVNTPFVFILDADNMIYPRCIARCLEAIQSSDATFVYPIIEKFGNETGLLGFMLWNPEQLAKGNYIDAMTLLRRSSMTEVGGYSHMKITGWEDYELWCKFVERGYYGVLVPEVLARYRVHGVSMLHTITNRLETIDQLIDDMMQRHPWMKLKGDTENQLNLSPE